MKVFYSENLVAEQGKQSFGGIQSPSARKPKEVAAALQAMPGIEIVAPSPLTIDDLKLCHDPKYVDGVMDLTLENGFGTRSKDICATLLYTNGAMYDAAKTALKESPTCALVSGFHHAGYKGWQGLGWFCTFNGLAITAAKLLNDGLVKSVSIVDCDMHWGNGTDDILQAMPELKEKVHHLTFGKSFHRPFQAKEYLKWMEPKGLLQGFLRMTKPDIILYQAGADVHVDDPYGGVLTTEQMEVRDQMMFTMSKELDIPIAWNLAGGYQIEADGSIKKVIDLHMNTFRICAEIYAS